MSIYGGLGHVCSQGVQIVQDFQNGSNTPGLRATGVTAVGAIIVGQLGQSAPMGCL